MPAMADVVYLHVGAPKTGTTYVQDRLLANRHRLAEHGVHYPVGLRADMFGAALDLIERSWGGQRQNVRGEWEALAKRVQRCEGTAIVSHEILAGATAEQARRAVEDLGAREVHVVYSARDLGRQIPAEWQESVKHRSRKPFRRYLRKMQRVRQDDSPMWFWRVQNVPDVLARWAADLPPERVHVVTVPQPGAPRDLLWHRFCQALALDPAWVPEDSARANSSLGIDEITMLRRLNKRLGRGKLDGTAYRRLVRQLIAHETLATRATKRRITVPPELRAWATDLDAAWVERLRTAGVDVVGDLAELMPVFPDPDERWLDPDRAKPRRMLDASLDALVASLQEAASRPDPGQTPAARLRRAGRRLARR